MKKWIVCCCVMLACGVAEAGKVILTQYDASATASLVGNTYTTTTTWNWWTYQYVTTETNIYAGQMTDSAAPNYNYLYAVTLSGTAHVVGTSYTWRIRPGTVTNPAGWGAPVAYGTQTATP